MTGFIKGLFSKKGGQAPKAAAPKPKSGDAFFLEPDDAKTFGDISYMREVKTVERTFPGGKRKPQTRQISSSTYRNMDGQAFAPSPNFTTTPSTQASSWGSTDKTKSFGSTPAPKPAETEKRRPGSNDTSMDMFRNMAKNIRKG